MICIIRIQAMEKSEQLWNEVINKKDALQKAISSKGKLLYVSKRCNYNEVSLFVHIADTNVLGDFVAEHVAKLEGVTGIWIINMLKPLFFPLTKDTDQMKRYTITAKTYSPRLSEAYAGIAGLKFPENIGMAYLSYTCHLFGDCLQFSLLVKEDGNVLNTYVNDVINKIPGILRTSVCEIEKTHPFISWDEWQGYITQNSVLVEYDAQLMINQFQK